MTELDPEIGARLELKRLRRRAQFRWEHDPDYDPVPPKVVEQARETFSQALDSPPARTTGYDERDPCDTEYEREWARERLERR